MSIAMDGPANPPQPRAGKSASPTPEVRLVRLRQILDVLQALFLGDADAEPWATRLRAVEQDWLKLRASPLGPGTDAALAALEKAVLGLDADLPTPWLRKRLARVRAAPEGIVHYAEPPLRAREEPGPALARRGPRHLAAHDLRRRRVGLDVQPG